MIITQTPYRVSFAGGGTDLPAFCEVEDGAVLSAAVRRHMYVTVAPRFEPTIRVSYTETEICDTVDEIRHSIIREALRRTGSVEPIEITTIGDVPAGTGMGSSSTLAVGILAALHALRGDAPGPEALAQQACELEIDALAKPIGRQDQYAAAYGGLNFMRFSAGGQVVVEPVHLSSDTLEEFERRLLLVYTGRKRQADSILRRQGQRMDINRDSMRRIRELAFEMRDVLRARGDLDEFARLLDTGWEIKRSLGGEISTGPIDDMYTAARRAGADGGRLLGAGAGGFLLLMALPERHDAIREALGNAPELPVRIDPRGSHVVFVSRGLEERVRCGC